MSKPSDRKRKKQKQRERSIAIQNHRIADRQAYAHKYPPFEFHESGAPAGLVTLIRQAANSLDFRDPRTFSVAERDFLQTMKRHPEWVGTHLKQAFATGNAQMLAMHAMIGSKVFERIPQEELRRWIPFHDVHFLQSGDRTIVTFRSLEQASTPEGRVYFSADRPTVEIDGSERIVAWSGHAIQRTCERMAPRWTSYLGLGDLFNLFYRPRRFVPCELSGGNVPGFSFFEVCIAPFFNAYYARQILSRHPRGACEYRVGYCPVAICEPFAVAKTFLCPGYNGTPEYGLILRAGHPNMSRSEAIKKLDGMTRTTLEETSDYSLLKYFHDEGIAQVIENCGDEFQD